MAVMSKKPHQQRHDILSRARALARSGQHADCASIEAAIQAVEGFEIVHRWFADWTFRAQLDALCALTRVKRSVARSDADPDTKRCPATEPAVLPGTACAEHPLEVQRLTVAGLRQRRMRQLYLSRYEVCTGRIPGLRLPHNAWTALARENITSLAQLKEAADRLEQIAGIGTHTAQVIRKELARRVSMA
jgi:hypothetical protein